MMTLQDAEMYAQHLLRYPKVRETLGPNPFIEAAVTLYQANLKLKEALCAYQITRSSDPEDAEPVCEGA